MLKLTAKEIAYYSLARVFDRVINREGLDGFEREVGEQAARAAGKPFDPASPTVPWQVFSRTVTVAGSSGATVAAPAAEAADVLRPVSTAIRAGAQVLPNLQSDLMAPSFATGSTGYWLDGEAASLTPTDPTLAGKLMKPKTCGALTSYTRQLGLQAEAMEALLRRHLLRLVGALMDAAILAGSGADGQPEGLLTVSGTATQSGTALDWAGATNMLEQAASADATDENIVFIGPPSVRELLQKREVVADTGRFVWADDRIAARRAFATTSMPAASLVTGDFSNILVGLWGAGPEVAVDPYSLFQGNVVRVRALLSMDVAVLQPGAFCKSTSIT